MFAGAVVAIEAPGPPAPAYLAAAVKGCSSALGSGRCIEATIATEPAPQWRAVVRTSSLTDPRVMVIEVRRDGTLFRRRILHFTDRDAVHTRWSTAGAVVAAVISGELEQPQSEETPEPAHPPEEPEPSEPWTPDEYTNDPIDTIDEFEPSGPPFFEVRGVALELLAAGGAEAYQGPLEFGPLLRAKLLLRGGPFVFAGVGGSAVPDNPLIVETDGFVGFGLPFQTSRTTAIDVGASWVGEWLWLRHEGRSGQSVSAQTWRSGGGLDVDFRLRLSRNWAAVMGGRATFLWPEVDIRRSGRQLAIILPAGLGLVFGVRYDFGDGFW